MSVSTEAATANELQVSDELYHKLAKQGTMKSQHLGRSYTAEEKIEVCTYWMTGYSSREIEKYTNIPSATIRSWMTTDWWKELLREVRRAKAEELDNTLTRIIEKSTKQLEERIEKGNFKHNPRTGELERIPLTASELARDGLGIPFDKRALTRGDPTSKVQREDTSTEHLLAKLAEQFIKITKQNEPKLLIDGEIVENV